jgi:hypothetical protein
MEAASMFAPRVVVAVTLLFASVSAQQFVVDPANGPGTSYTSLDAAIAAVPDGSTLIVRAAVYPKVIIDAKSLTVLCDPGVLVNTSLDWYLTIRNTGPNQPVTVRGLRTSPAGQQTAFQVLNALGPVTIDGQGSSMAMSSIPIYQSPSVVGSAQVLVKQCSIAMVSATIVMSSHVVFEDCTFRGRDKSWFSMFAFVGPSPGLVLTNSRVHLVRCSAFGGLGDTANPSQPAVVLDATSQLRLLHSGSYAGGGTAPGVQGNGALRSDPAVVIAGGGTLPAVAAMPSLATTDAPPGGALGAVHSSANTAIFVIVVGWPGPVVDVPGVIEPIWFDLASFVGVATGVGPVPGGSPASVAVPPSGALVGTRLCWQSFDLSPAGIEASNPSVAIVR